MRHAFMGMLTLFLAAVFVNAALYALRRHALRRLPAHDGPGVLGLLRAGGAFLQECAALVVVTVLLPLGCIMRRQDGETGGRGTVLVVPDWGLNRGSLWMLRRRLVRDGWGPVLCLTEYNVDADFESAARRLCRDLERGSLPREGNVTLIGHGLGGLIVRECARLLEDGRVHRLVTLGTPHAGTHVAWHLPLLRHRLAPDAGPMRRLRAEHSVVERYDVVAIHSVFDATIVPPAAGIYPGAFNVQINGVGHFSLLFSGRVYGLLVENLLAPLPAGPATRPAVTSNAEGVRGEAAP